MEYFIIVNNRSAIIEVLQKSPHLSVGIGVRGHWVGKDAPRRAWENFVRRHRNPGDFSLHPINTPVIEVAGEGRTAKAIWVATGLSAKKILKRGKVNASGNGTNMV